jgi:D-glycero-D-manno-heptose 1,7-bisphosphate phosphatase
LTAAVFLDRDGVLNRSLLVNGKPVPPREVEEVELFAGVVEACEQLRARGYALIVVTNQPDIARGTISRAAVDAINDFLASRVPLDEIVVCPHDDADGCSCRKPRPGMLLDAASRHELDLRKSYLVGDRWRDIGAGQAAGCTTVFIDRGYDERQPTSPDAVVRDLPEAASWILQTDARNRD